MMFLADISGQFIFFIVFAAIGVINWWLEKKKKEADSGSTPPPSGPRQTGTGGSANDSEQERLRRFLEALGVPQPPAQQPPRPQPAPPPAVPRPRPTARPAAQAAERRVQAPKPPPRVIRAPKPVVAEPEEFQLAGRLEEPAASIENISGEFQRMNVHVTMPPVQSFQSAAHLASPFAGTTKILTREGNPTAESLRRLLRDPADLRAVFVAMEVLGPARGLQNLGELSSLRPL